MTFDQLLYFREVARIEHLGRAASLLRLSPSAVSTSLTLLQQELGHKLFEKQGRRLVLNENGRRLLIHAEKILASVEQAKLDIRGEHQTSLTGHFRIVVSHGLSSRILAPILTKIQADFSEDGTSLSFELYSERSANVINGLLHGNCDIGVCFSAQPQPQIIKSQIYEGELGIYVNHDNPILKSRSCNLKNLSRLPAFLPKAFSGVDVCESHPMFEAYQIVPNAVLLYDSYEVALQAISSSQGWTLAPDIMYKYFSSRVSPVKLPKSWSAPYSVDLIVQKHRPLTLLTNLLHQHLADVLVNGHQNST